MFAMLRRRRAGAEVSRHGISLCHCAITIMKGAQGILLK